MYCVVHVFGLNCFWLSFGEYGYVSLDEPKYLCFKVLGWWLKGAHYLGVLVIEELIS